MFRLLKKYYKLEYLERSTLNQIFFWLIYSVVLVRLAPLRWFSGLLGEFNKTSDFEINQNQIEIIKLIKKNIRRSKRVLPWKVKCFEEAIAAKMVLKKQKIKSTLYLGVDKDKEQKLIAHAWLKAGDYIVTGRQGREKYAVVGFYN